MRRSSSAWALCWRWWRCRLCISGTKPPWRRPKPRRTCQSPARARPEFSDLTAASKWRSTIEPWLRGFHLEGQLQQLEFRVERASELHPQWQAFGRPMQWHRHGRATCDVGQLRVGCPGQVLDGDLLELRGVTQEAGQLQRRHQLVDELQAAGRGHLADADGRGAERRAQPEVKALVKARQGVHVLVPMAFAVH